MNKYTGIPKTIKVGAKIYTVKMVTDLKSAYDAARLYAQCNNAEQRLEFDPTVGGDAVGHVIHECLHAIVDQCQFPRLTGSQEEQIVKRLAHGLAALFVDNPGLMSWLKQRSKL